MTDQPLFVRVPVAISHPGGAFTVEVGAVEGADLSEARAVVVSLICQHDCRRGQLPASTPIYEQARIELVDGSPAVTTIELPVPEDAPISFTGALIRNLWQIEVSLDIARKEDPTVAVREVLVTPSNGTTRWTSPHPLR